MPDPDTAIPPLELNRPFVLARFERAPTQEGVIDPTRSEFSDIAVIVSACPELKDFVGCRVLTHRGMYGRIPHITVDGQEYCLLSAENYNGNSLGGDVVAVIKGDSNPRYT